MTRGGKRQGSGRRKGAVVLITRQIANEQAAKGEITPLEVMLDNMRHFHREAVAAEQAFDVITAGELGDDPTDALDRLKAAAKRGLGLRKASQTCAFEAARYMHAPAAPADPAAKPHGDFVPLPERLKAYTARDLIESKDGKVVSLRRRRGGVWS